MSEDSVEESSRNRGGRPKKSASEKKLKIIKISLSQSEYKFMEDHARRSGCSQLARFMRECVVGLVKEGKFSYFQQQNASRDLIDNIYKIGINLNQIAYHLNQETETVSTTQKQVGKDVAELKGMLRPFLVAMHKGETRVAALEDGDDHGNS